MFKNHLDVFHGSIPDQPTVTGLGRGAETNIPVLGSTFIKY